MSVPSSFLSTDIVSIGVGELNGPIVSSAPNPIHLDYPTLDRAHFADLAPDVVLAWLYCDFYDAIDIACWLKTVEFSGVLKLVSLPLPKPNLVIYELRRVNPDLQVELVSQTLQDYMANPYEAALRSHTITPPLPVFQQNHLQLIA